MPDTAVFSSDIGGDEAAFLDLEFVASESYTRFVYDSDEQALRVRRYLFDRQLCEFSPPYGSLLRVAGQPVGLIAGLPAPDLARCRLRAALALSKSGMLGDHPALDTRVRLAGQALAKLELDDYYISRLAVAPSARGAGRGTVLLEHADRAARRARARRIVLEVAPGSEAALRLYGRAGFTPRATRRVTDPASGRLLAYIHMAKELG